MKRSELKDFFKNWYNGEFSSEDSSHLLGEFGADDTSRLLLEQEEDDPFAEEGGDEEGEDDPFAEEGEEDVAADEEVEGEEDAEAAEVEEVAIEAGDEVRLGKQFDIALDSILADYEMNALKSAQIHVAAQEDLEAEATATTTEWWNRGLDNLLFEQEEPAVEEEGPVVSEAQLDIDLFSEDVARFIKNYQVLMDMESIIFNKAKEFLIVKYGDDVAEAFAEILRLRHGMDFDTEIEELEDIGDVAPLAVGASGGGGGGGGAV